MSPKRPVAPATKTVNDILRGFDPTTSITV